MSTSRVGSGTGFGMTVSRIGNAEYQYTFDTPMADNKYVVLAQTQEEEYETTRVKNKTVNGFRITTAWVKARNDGTFALEYSDNDHAVAVFDISPVTANVSAAALPTSFTSAEIQSALDLVAEDFTARVAELEAKVQALEADHAAAMNNMNGGY